MLGWQWTTLLFLLGGYLAKKRKPRKIDSRTNEKSDWTVLWRAISVAAKLYRGRFHSFPTRLPYLQKAIQCCELLRPYVEGPTILAAYLLRDILIFQPTAVYTLSDIFDTPLLHLAQVLMEEKSTLNSYLGSLSRQHSKSLSFEKKANDSVLSRSNSNLSLSSLPYPSPSLLSALDNSLNHSYGGIYTREDEMDPFSSEDDISSPHEQMEKEVSVLSRSIFLAEVLFHLLELKQLLEDGLLVQQSIRYCEYAREVVDFMRGSNVQLENEIGQLIECIQNSSMNR
ncbi:hypothetical protein GpartN1_g6071.t1 [Galdieria partita]|uniref:Uncharacterized protein n=1 Tax=Galdieria partita TaxID=83374 RepID=A0A9C7Q1R3_9RHOD|nr:hypothetical protein GpartN1_g6071.t1 [Galdieria partita]